MSEGKVFKSENEGMLKEFATGLRDHCKQTKHCEDCMFYTTGDDWDVPSCLIQDSAPAYWRI